MISAADPSMLALPATRHACILLILAVEPGVTRLSGTPARAASSNDTPAIYPIRRVRRSHGERHSFPYLRLALYCAPCATGSQVWKPHVIEFFAIGTAVPPLLAPG